jgi:hypothetical protein
MNIADGPVGLLACVSADRLLEWYRTGLRRHGNLLNRIKLMLPVQSPHIEIFPFPATPNHD